MLPNSPQRSKRRPLQFSVLALLITTTILGPLLGWYGPAAYSRLHEILAPEPITQTPPLWVRQKARLAAQRQKLRTQLQQMQQRVTDAQLLAGNAQRQLDNSRELNRVQDGSIDMSENVERGMQSDVLERQQNAID